jgi:uncharacterized coiled-coil DUF342 family protein
LSEDINIKNDEIIKLKNENIELNNKLDELTGIISKNIEQASKYKITIVELNKKITELVLEDIPK